MDINKRQTVAVTDYSLPPVPPHHNPIAPTTPAPIQESTPAHQYGVEDMDTQKQDETKRVQFQEEQKIVDQDFKEETP